jgi:Reverse transcriptase (RNA-dependent DNA polymerase)/GAG-pre-integrase domain/Integrase core domain
LNNIIDQILADEARRIRSSGEDATAYFAKASKKGKGRDKDRDRRWNKKKCSHCSHIGHDVTECQKLKKEKEDEKKAKEKAAVASTSDSGASADSAAKAAVARIPTDEVVRLFRATAVEQPYAGIEHVHTTKTTLEADDLHNSWLVDSGASCIMSSRCDWFRHYTPLAKPIKVVLRDDSAIPAVGIGRLFVRMYTGSQWTRAILQDVLHVPDLHGNLLSVSHFDCRGHEVRFADNGCQLLDKSSNLICVGHLQGNLYTMDIKVSGTDTARVAHIDEFPSEGTELSDCTPTAFANVAHADLTTWHRRFSHMHMDAINHMLEKGMVTGMKLTSDSAPPTPCEPCLKAKQTHKPIQKTTNTRADQVLGRVFSDVCGKISTRSHQGFEYFVTWIDDKSRKVSIHGLHQKSEVEEALKVFVLRAEVETGMPAQTLCSDGGGEYTASSVQAYLKQKGIKHKITTPDTPQHNGVTERMNWTLLDKVRAMLLDAQLPKTYWYDALQYVVHIHNITPTRALKDQTPEEAWSGNKPDVSSLRVFGCQAFIHVPDKHRTKLGAKSLKCTLLGYAPQRKAYRLVHRPSKRFLESRDVIFDEGGQAPVERVSFEHNDANEPLQPQTTSHSPNSTSTAVHPKRNARAPTRDDNDRYTITSYSPRKSIDEHASVAQSDVTSDLKTYAKAMSWPDAAQWEMACTDEMRAFEHMGVYEVVPRPAGRKIVGSKWVFHIKRGPTGEIQKYKARIVAQGFTQIEGIDYNETFTPVTKLTSIRTILTIAAKLNLEVQQMDVKSAYLNAKLEEEIYMAPPPGLDMPDGMVLRLVKAVYR